MKKVEKKWKQVEKSEEKCNKVDKLRPVEKRDIHITWDYLVDKSPTLVSKTNVHSL